ncbi:hypothetical protein AB0K11_02660 [Mycobacterium sp. NPDC050551]|uniref:hypothetical protein n=1 Tax=Mycobacterium sp. NPDC050551 TaxID=3155407 RepID=UPI0034473BEF
MTDDWDQEFGHRTSQKRSGGQVKVILLRQFDGSWTLQVLDDEEPEASAVELAQLRSDLVSGVRAAGYEATVRQKPTFGTADRG